MEITIKIIVGLVAFIHVYIMAFEMFLWESKGPKIFKSFDKALFPKTKAMALNQGLYNGFLAAGLIWSFFISDIAWQANVALFFLACVFVAGIIGTFTVERKIFFIQSVPSLAGIILILMSQS